MSLTILTVDDSVAIREMLRVVLHTAGYRVVQAEDGMHGLQLLDSENPAVIVTDINMPRLDGYGFIAQIRADPRHRTTPILVLSTEGGSEKRARARDAGASGWIVKPIDPAVLIDALRSLAA